MTPVAGRLRRWFLAPAPPERLAVLRILVGGYGVVYLLIRSGYIVDLTRLPATRFEPVGVLGLLGSPPPDGLVLAALVAAVATGVAFCAGWRYVLTAPAYAALLVVVTTYGNSWGQVFHTENLLVVHTVVLAVSPAAAALSVDAARSRRPTPAPDWRFGWPVVLMAVVCVTTYFLAGWAKLGNGGLEWAVGDVLRNQVAHDNLRKILLGDVHSPIGARLVGFGWIFPPMAVLSIVVELGAPLALLGPRVARVWAGAAWAFHVGVLALMAVFFPYPILGVAFAPLFAVERLVRPARAVARRIAPRTRARRAPATSVSGVAER